MIDTDHIIPEGICKIFLPLTDLSKKTYADNIVEICRPRHQRLDIRKFRVYRSGGLAWLMELIANDYPRSQDEGVLDLQFAQFRRLFLHLYTSIESYLNSLKGINLAEETIKYESTLLVAERHLNLWEKDRETFNISIPTTPCWNGS